MGWREGYNVGVDVGHLDGKMDGCIDGLKDGKAEGLVVGCEVGSRSAKIDILIVAVNKINIVFIGISKDTLATNEYQPRLGHPALEIEIVEILNIIFTLQTKSTIIQ